MTPPEVAKAKRAARPVRTVSPTAIRAIAVVIPARDEEELIGQCLRSVQVAVQYLQTARGTLAPPVTIIVVADGCLDRTASVARAFPGVRVVELESANVGAARASGVDAALATRHVPEKRLWIANTDADSVVPRHWLSHQLELADAGHDVMIGTVRPDFKDLTAAQIRAWRATHKPGAANGHVHGANLGVRASAYTRAGGYLSRAEHEDNDLVDRLRETAADLLATDRCEVVTSGRQVGRTPGGYAGYLRSQLLELASHTAAQQVTDAQ
ncbi:glycosyltransferase family A protein [Glaciihabitans sp. dw_435]|uniref:glycosyltransferase n=1 Tax=Glaciihabitans sp. dw_435 TaxID=2720081 RepID=UPI0027DE1B0D|nr:glycosyltransferase family A protein [Glaciihabitans sp. dw_435]